jgi:hypothetical protein
MARKKSATKKVGLKGLSSKPSGKMIVAPNLCFLAHEAKALKVLFLFS